MPETKNPEQSKWISPVPQDRWRGSRRVNPGPLAFKSLKDFEDAQKNELEFSLEDHEREALGRLLGRCNKDEIELFLKTHGVNPIFDPRAEINIKVGVAKADLVSLEFPASPEANQAFLNGDIVYVLFQAGEASRFNRGPMYSMNPVEVARDLQESLGLQDALKALDEKAKKISGKAGEFLLNGNLGPKQCVMIRAGLRRIIQDEIRAKRLSPSNAAKAYEDALKKQKVIFFVGKRGGLDEQHEKTLREEFKFFGFDPRNVVTVAQELAHGLNVDDRGQVTLCEGEAYSDAAGHCYAMSQACRPGDFVTYTEKGEPVTPEGKDAFEYLSERGGKILSIIRINDMDRHSVEIANAKALTYTLQKFKEGFLNVIEGVANPSGQKGGTGTTFHDPEIHVLTETHENSFPVLSRAFEQAMQEYLKENEGSHPAYNAMRQWCDLKAARQILQEYGPRIVFVPRKKKVDGKEVCYVGVDMPMGDLSLLMGEFKSRMFQLTGPGGKELLIHDMKKVENLDIAVRTVERQLEDPFAVAAAKEIFSGKTEPFAESVEYPYPYGAPAPEFH